MSANFSKKALNITYALGHIGWVLLAMFGVTTLVLGAIVGVAATIGGLSEEDIMSPLGLLLIFALQFIIALGFTSLLPLWQVKWKPALLKELFGVSRKLQARDVYLPLLIMPLYFVTSAVVISVFGMLFPGIDLDQAQDVGFSAENLSGIKAYVLAFLALVVMAPVSEELLFRGYLFGKLRVLVGALAAGLLTSVTFGLAHGQWNVGIDTFVLSLYLCWLRHYTGAVWASMLLHSLKNLLAYTLLFLLPLFGFDLVQLLS